MPRNTRQTEINIEAIWKRLNELSNKEYAVVSMRFFKTGPGEYGEGDQFVGIRVPTLRKLAKEFKDLSTRDAQILLSSPIHEARLLSLLLLMHHYANGGETTKRKIHEFYLAHTRFVNNWDLVDLSAEHIVGDYLRLQDKSPLYRLALSRDIWRRRISILATFCYIKRKEFETTLKISEMLLQDREDLIQKAVGWMLREVGKRDLSSEEAFLKSHYHEMPRTMLRYAIERFPEEIRKNSLNGRV